MIFQTTYLQCLVGPDPEHTKTTHIHTHSNWDNLDMPTHFTGIGLGFGRKSKYLEKTHAETG